MNWPRSGASLTFRTTQLRTHCQNSVWVVQYSFPSWHMISAFFFFFRRWSFFSFFSFLSVGICLHLYPYVRFKPDVQTPQGSLVTRQLSANPLPHFHDPYSQVARPTTRVTRPSGSQRIRCVPGVAVHWIEAAFVQFFHQIVLKGVHDEFEATGYIQFVEY